MPGIVSAASLAANQRARSRREWGEYATFLAFVVPNLLLLGIFSYWPLIQNISLSFTEWDMISPDKRFVGLDNWISVLSSPRFWQIILNTAIFTVGSVGLTLILGLGAGAAAEPGAALPQWRADRHFHADGPVRSGGRGRVVLHLRSELGHLENGPRVGRSAVAALGGGRPLGNARDHHRVRVEDGWLRGGDLSRRAARHSERAVRSRPG